MLSTSCYCLHFTHSGRERCPDCGDQKRRSTYDCGRSREHVDVWVRKNLRVTQGPCWRPKNLTPFEFHQLGSSHMHAIYQHYSEGFIGAGTLPSCCVTLRSLSETQLHPGGGSDDQASLSWWASSRPMAALSCWSAPLWPHPPTSSQARAESVKNQEAPRQEVGCMKLVGSRAVQKGL